MKSIYLLPLFTTFALTNAESNGTIPETLFGPGPYYDDVFREANTSPNATGAVDILAINMSVGPMVGIEALWSAHLNITEVTNLHHTPSPSTDVITNSVISIDTRGGWVETLDWDTTFVIFLDVARNATVDGQKDTGDCHATLGEKCVRDYSQVIESAIHSTRASKLNTTVIPPPPASCKYRLSSASISNQFESKYANGSAYIHHSSAVHNASDTISYQEATTRIWPIFLRQGGRGGAKNVTGIAMARMSCLRANATTEGSEAIGGVPGAAVGIRVYEWAVVGVACLVGGLLV
ncbi:uncharacterized protein BP5553_09684 [Venustampulla echinocandica]|uniref:Uncharacterized protein n=1 Tax=Venustampulla echinocandica TaxID=2656787 RepID=A0A370TBQ5_9HELO|nr:uncharacterized protein BP5553_09684 [Venustampulla echinocandica]RDL31475.1 hypothetical protein BP5553_09684 [Venustampulla echinocandica]